MMKLLSAVLFAALVLNTSCASTDNNAEKEGTAPPGPFVFPDNVPQSGHTYRTSVINTSPDGSRFATANTTEREIKIWDSETYRVQVVMKTENDPFRSLKWSHDGRFIVSLTGSTGAWTVWYAEVWDSYTGKRITYLRSGERRAVGAALSGDSKYLLLGEEMFLAIEDQTTGKIKKVTFGSQSSGYTRIRSIISGPAGTDMVLITTGTGYRLYSARRGWVGDEFDPPVTASQWRPKDAVFSPDGKTFLVSVTSRTGDDDIAAMQKAFLYSITAKQPISSFRISTGAIEQMRFSPDGKQLFVESDNGEMNIFDVASGQQLDILDLAERNKQVRRP